jgi:hypothetical protein
VAQAGQQLLDLDNGLAGVETLGAGHRAVHNRVAPEENLGHFIYRSYSYKITQILHCFRCLTAQYIIVFISRSY